MFGCYFWRCYLEHLEIRPGGADVIGTKETLCLAQEEISAGLLAPLSADCLNRINHALERRLGSPIGLGFFPIHLIHLLSKKNLPVIVIGMIMS